MLTGKGEDGVPVSVVWTKPLRGSSSWLAV
jgi:hypothetical protein